MRYGRNLITGKMRSTDPQSLDIWHFAQEFADTPTLDSTFIQEDPQVERCIAVEDEPHFIGDFLFRVINARPMPTYSIPGYIDHF